jgi:hypothetical protein
MATITTLGSGNWSSTTVGLPWPGGTLPTNADDVVIANTHTVTLETTAPVALTVTIQSGGTLTCSTTASSTLTMQRGMTVNSGGTLNLDVTSDVTKICTLIFNNSASASPGYGLTVANGGNITMKGFAKTRWTTLSAGVSIGATTASVAAATGWQTGDKLVFATTQAYNATPKVDNATGTNTVSGTSISNLTALTYAHDSGGYVGNFSSNLILKGATPGTTFWFVRMNSVEVASTRDICDVMYWATRGDFSTPGVRIDGGNYDITTTPWVAFNSNAFYDARDCGVYIEKQWSDIPRQNNIFYLPNNGSGTFGSAIFYAGSNKNCGADVDSVIFQSAQRGINGAVPGVIFTRPKVSSCLQVGIYGDTNSTTSLYGVVVNDGDFFANNDFMESNAASIEFNGCRIGSQYSGAAINNVLTDTQFYLLGTFRDCVFQNTNTSLTTNISTASVSTQLTLINKGVYPSSADVTVQEIYRKYGSIKRYNGATNTKRSTSSVYIAPNVVAKTVTYEVTIPCATGATIRVLGNVKAETAFYSPSWTAPTVTLSGTIAGTVLTPAVFTASSAANNAFESVDISLTNSAGADGNLTLTFAATLYTGKSGGVYFDGMPTSSPFVTKARHYGFTFDQTLPYVVTNSTVSANESTALGYSTKFGITGATSAIALTADGTLQQMYEYSQAWACTTANLASVIPLTAVGLATAPIVSAVGNITTTGYTLNGAGSLSIPSGKTITASLPFSYSYTNGTWSQLTTVPTFAGGQLNLGAAGTYTFTMSSAIISMTPTAPGTYALGAATFSGTIDLRNTSAHAITVELPSGTSYTTASNTGGTITVSLPVVTASVSITGMPDAGAVPTRLQIINTTAETAAAWQAATVYTAGAIRLRTSGIGTENTAGLYLRCTTGGTSAGTEPTWNTTPGGTTTDGTAVWTTYKILFYDADPAGTTYSTTYIDGEEFLAGEVVDVRFAEMDGGTSFKTYSTATVASASGFSALVAEEIDDVYATNGLDGSAYEATFSPNFTADYIVLDSNADFAGIAAYAYFCYTLTSSNGMYRFWGGVTAIDVGNYRIETDVLDLYFDESAGFVKQTDNVRIFRKDGLRPAIDPTTGGHGLEINWRTPVSVVSTGGSALTPSESAQLMALPSASANATAVWAKTLP